MARGIFITPVRRKTTAVWVKLIGGCFKIDGVDKADSLIIPIRLAAIQLAEGLLAPITAWLTGEAKCSVDALALALRQAATATVLALSRAR